MSKTLPAVLGGAVGAVALVALVIVILWFYMCRNRSVSRTSETGSSDRSIQVARTGGFEMTLREPRRFVMEELSSASQKFNDKSLIGEGKFGEVYKGLLHDGTLVAIKKRAGAPSQDFVEEVRYLTAIHHWNLVTLLGYCQENEQQILVYEYIPNGSVSIHLYGTEKVTKDKLEFKHRLSIALGAAKGLAHIHSLSPRLVHKDFKTANVLVDENFIAKVSDVGICNFLRRGDTPSSSSQKSADQMFLAPEVREFSSFSEKSDVYSFGVFLLELVSKQEVVELFSDSKQYLVEWVQNLQDSGTINDIIDNRLGNTFTKESMEEYVHLIISCVNPSSEGRPVMSYVVMELDRILEKEMSLTTIMGEGTPVVTLGSHLFRASK